MISLLVGMAAMPVLTRGVWFSPKKYHKREKGKKGGKGEKALKLIPQISKMLLNIPSRFLHLLLETTCIKKSKRGVLLLTPNLLLTLLITYSS